MHTLTGKSDLESSTVEQLLVLVSKHRSMVVFSVIHIWQQRNITSTCTSSQSSTLIVVKHFSNAFMSVLYSGVHTCRAHATWIGTLPNLELYAGMAVVQNQG